MSALFRDMIGIWYCFVLNFLPIGSQFRLVLFIFELALRLLIAPYLGCVPQALHYLLVPSLQCYMFLILNVNFG